MYVHLEMAEDYYLSLLVFQESGIDISFDIDSNYKAMAVHIV